MIACRLATVFVLVLLLVACSKAPPPAGGGSAAGEAAPAVPSPLAPGSHVAVLNGFDIHYEVHGQGPVVMTVANSWGFTGGGLRALLQGLEKRLTVVYFDPRGMGGSAPIREEADLGMAAVRADFDALRRHLGLDQVDAIGWSNGAMNLILLAAERPETIRSAVFVHGAASFSEQDMAALGERHPGLMERYQVFEQEAADPALTDEQRTARLKALWLDEWFPLSSADPEASLPMLRNAFGDIPFSYRHADYANRESPTFDARDRLPAITARCLVVAGAHDMFPVEKAHELRDGLADSTLRVFDHSGHFAPLEEPEAFEAAVFAFLGV